MVAALTWYRVSLIGVQTGQVVILIERIQGLHKDVRIKAIA